MEVRKSDNSVEEYSIEKISRGVRAAYEAVGEPCDDIIVNTVLNSLSIYDNITTAEIRKQIEHALMELNHAAAHAYIETYDRIVAGQVALAKKQDFIKNYIAASNAATGSKYDSNANVTSKNIVTMGEELYKYDNIKQNRKMLYDRIKHLYGKKMAKQYIADLESHVLYKHDETAIPGKPYCVAITMFPFLTEGLTKLGGESTSPTDLKSFCGEFINLVYTIASQFAGAVATPEFLMYMDYFIRKDYGDDYVSRIDEVVDLSRKKRTIGEVIDNCFQQVVHSMNMPTGARGYQTVFWNVGYFDKSYFEGVFGDFAFPDGSKPIWDTLSYLQKRFMKWFNTERTKYILTFPVETMAMLTDGHDIVDQEYADFTSEMWSEGHSFFVYLSDSPDSLSSCCRLRNSLKDMEDEEHNHNTHQFSTGTASVATGSKSVMTINLNRVIQDAVNAWRIENNVVIEHGKPLGLEIYKRNKEDILKHISIALTSMTEKVHKYQIAFNSLIKDFFESDMLPVYSAGFIHMRKQYLTVGVNGLTDAAEFLGIETNNNDTYAEFVNLVLETINMSNRKDKTREHMFNTEFVPGENLSNKNYNWDKRDGYFVSPKHEMYSSYFFNPEDESLSVLDKMKLHGEKYVKYLDGGSACHINIKEHMTKLQYRQLLRVAAENGTNYFTFNCRNTVCNDCGYISKDTLDECPKCGSKNLDYLTRIIGYLKRVSSFSEPRQREEHVRAYK